MGTIGNIRQFKSQKAPKSSDSNQEQFIWSLPEDLLMSCLARVPISNYQSMSQVCRAWRRMLKKKQVWKARHDLKAAEAGSLVFFCSLGSIRLRNTGSKLRKEVAVWRAFHPLSNTWFQVPEMPEDGRAPGGSAYATLDGKLFVIGGELKHSGLPCKTVSYFDVSQYCWRLGPPLNVPRSNCTVGVVGHTLYVFGGFTTNSIAAAEDVQDARVLLQTAEVYDPFVGSWRFVSTKIPTQIDYSIVMNGKFFAIGTSGEDIRYLKHRMSLAGDWTRLVSVMGIVYDPHTNEWTQMAHNLMESWGRSSVDFNGRLYIADSYDSLKFYDSSRNSWQSVELTWERIQSGNLSSEKSALQFVRNFLRCYFELKNMGGKLCMVGVRPFPQQAFVAVLDIEEHFSENAIRIQAKVVMLEDVTNWIRGSRSEPRLRLMRLLSCQLMDA